MLPIFQEFGLYFQFIYLGEPWSNSGNKGPYSTKFPNYEDNPGPPYNHKITGYFLSSSILFPAFYAPYIINPNTESDNSLFVAFKYPEKAN